MRVIWTLIDMGRAIVTAISILSVASSHCSLLIATRVIWAVLVFIIPFLAYGFNILHSFYDVGNAFQDAGWSAYLIHDGDLQLHNPPGIGAPSWFNFHVSPLFWATSALGHLVPLTRI